MNEHGDLEGLGALVTGATSGIGRAVAEHLARNGAEHFHPKASAQLWIPAKAEVVQMSEQTSVAARPPPQT